MEGIMSPMHPSSVPALTPPPGVVPNFVDPYSLSPAFFATAVLCLLLATVSVFIRLFTSLKGPHKNLRIEDCTCIVSWLGLIETCVMTVFEIHEGLGRHQWDVPKSNLTPMLKLFYINRIFYSPTILAAKLTILLQITRIFIPTKRGLVYWLVQTLIWSNVCFYAANVLSVIFQCHPVHKAWIKSTPGSCVDTNLNLVVTGSINVVSDILILALPFWIIWHLKIPIRSKLSVSAVFAVGIVANLAGIMRLVYSVHIVRGTDLTYLRLQHGMWTIAEITTAITCASLPLVPQFVGLLRSKHSPSLLAKRAPQSEAYGRSDITGSRRRGSSCTELNSSEDGEVGEINDSASITKSQVYPTGP